MTEEKYCIFDSLEPTREKEYFVENCAEIWAARDAILQGAKFDNLVIRSVTVADGQIKALCDNCKITFEHLVQAMQ